MLLPYDIAIPYLGIYTREMKTYPQKDLYKNVHKSQNILNSQKLETAKVIINRKMGSEAYSYNRLQPSNTKQHITGIFNNMDKSQDYTE